MLHVLLWKGWNYGRTYRIQWLVCGDFNVILDDSEKLRGLEVTQQEIEDFTGYESSCALNKLRFTESSYTWWNSRIEILDRVFGNNVFF